MDLRAAFLGDSYVAGAGDDSALGWVGRVAAAARIEGADFTAYNLGVRYETGPQVAARAAVELAPRFQWGDAYALVAAFGANDISRGVPLEATLAAAAGLIATAAGLGAAPFLISPPVFQDDRDKDAAAEMMTAALAALCAQEAVAFLDLRTAVTDWPLWWSEARVGDGAHPNGAGYALIAAAVSAWPPWRAWLATGR